MPWAPERLEAIRAWLRGWVESGRLASAHVTVVDNGDVVLAYGQGGMAEPIADDTVVRIYSMSKPVTAVAALQLVDDGRLSLDDPVSRFVPSFADVTVNRGRSGDLLDPVPASTPMTVRHLLMHTSGLTYGQGNPGAVSALYERDRCDFDPGDGPIAEVVERLAGIPLLFGPGSAWNYGVSSDVLGRVIEVAAGRPLDQVVRSGILEPLGMADTTFRAADVPPARLAPLFEADADGRPTTLDRSADLDIPPERLTLSGGGGMLSSSRDYVRFAEMLRCGGTLDGVEILRPETVAAMTRNQLDGDLQQLDEASLGDEDMSGIGWGYGVSVVIDPRVAGADFTAGEFGWGGYANTLFSVDPVHQVTVVFMTQLIPSGLHPLSAQLRRLVAEARPPTP